jgi:hypothetical protein
MICQLHELTRITNKHQEPRNARLGSGRICWLVVVFNSIGGNRLDFAREPSNAADG